MVTTSWYHNQARYFLQGSHKRFACKDFAGRGKTNIVKGAVLLAKMH
jgi:hypothetical protein